MDGFARIETACRLEKADRVPVSPLIIGYAAGCAGFTQRQVYRDFALWLRALDVTYGKIGLCDSVFPRWPYDVARLQMMRCRMPGDGIGEDSPAQLIESELMKREDYRLILDKGYMSWFFSLISGFLGVSAPFPLCVPLVIPRFLRVNMRSKRIARAWQARGVPLGFDSACYPPFDLFSLVRSMECFFYDLFDCPDVVEQACEKSVEDVVRFAKMPLRFTKGNKIAVYPMRSSASFISREMFERFSFPYLRRIVEAFHRDGIVSVLHCDGDWTPYLKYFLQFPAASCIVELDEKTNIFQAKRILGGHLCLKGNVPSSLLAFGNEDEVREYCSRLIHEVGRDGGFILSSGCEVPVNARDENVKALVSSVSLV